MENSGLWAEFIKVIELTNRTVVVFRVHLLNLGLNLP